MRIVHIQTEYFDAEALHISELPGMRVMAMLAEDDDHRRAGLMVKTLQDALIDPAQLLNLQALSFDQLIEVLNLYATLPPIEKEIKP